MFFVNDDVDKCAAMAVFCSAGYLYVHLQTELQECDGAQVDTCAS